MFLSHARAFLSTESSCRKQSLFWWHSGSGQIAMTFARVGSNNTAVKAFRFIYSREYICMIHWLYATLTAEANSTHRLHICFIQSHVSRPMEAAVDSSSMRAPLHTACWYHITAANCATAVPSRSLMLLIYHARQYTKFAHWAWFQNVILHVSLTA